MNLRLLLPFDNVKLLTKLSPAEVQSRIERVVEPQQPFRMFFKKGEKPYQGKYANATFEISRTINGRNSFLPIIKGRMSPNMGQTEILIKMRPVVFVLVFMTFWLGAVGSVCAVIVIAIISQLETVASQGFSPAVLIPFGMFAFGYVLLIFSYRAESHESKTFLKQLFEAEGCE